MPARLPLSRKGLEPAIAWVEPPGQRAKLLLKVMPPYTEPVFGAMVAPLNWKRLLAVGLTEM